MADDARAIYREGFQHFVNDRLDEAVAAYRRALAIDDGLALAWTALSRALRQQGDLDAAIEAGRKVVELEPNDPLSHTNLSILFQAKGMIQEAEDEKALATRLEAGSRS